VWVVSSINRWPVLSFVHLFTAVPDRGPLGYAACGCGCAGMFSGMPLTQPTSVLEVFLFECNAIARKDIQLSSRT
jgi:hypothetical protein